jgi:hypothetical protein
MTADVLTKEQFDKEWREREKLLSVPARVHTQVRGIEPAAAPRELLVARTLFAAVLEALVDFDGAMPAPRPRRRRIQRK